MKKNQFWLILFLLATTGLSCRPARAQAPKLYIIRHAEKLDGWPGGEASKFQPLSEKGLAAARRLADHFKPGQLTAIFSSATTRTLHTALPVAQKLGLQIQIASACADTAAIDSFLTALKQRYGPDDAVLLVSHSNIIPYLLIKAGLPKACYAKMDFTEWEGGLLTDYYGELFSIENFANPKPSCADFRRQNF